MSNTVRLHRVLRTRPERLYRAFIDPAAMAKWLPPNGFTGTVHQMDARVGGSWRMSFANFSRARDILRRHLPRTRAGREAALHEPFRRPGLPGEMTTTVTITNTPFGSEMHVVQEGIPDVIPVEACYLGWQESLVLLAKLVEAEIPNE